MKLRSPEDLMEYDLLVTRAEKAEAELAAERKKNEFLRLLVTRADKAEAELADLREAYRVLEFDLAEAQKAEVELAEVKEHCVKTNDDNKRLEAELAEAQRKLKEEEKYTNKYIEFLHKAQAERDKFKEAARRLILYAILHEQDHPEHNGARNDDLAFARDALEGGEP